MWLMNLLSGTHWLLIFSLPGTDFAFSFVLSVSWELGLASLRLGTSKIPSDRNVGCMSSVARVLLTTAGSQGNYLSLSFGYLWKWEGNIFCTLFGNASCVQGVIQYLQEYLLFIQAETWQDIWKGFLSSSMVRSWLNWKPIKSVSMCMCITCLCLCICLCIHLPTYLPFMNNFYFYLGS